MNLALLGRQRKKGYTTMPIWNPPIYPPETGDLAEPTHSTHCTSCHAILASGDLVAGSRNRDYSPTYTRTFWHYPSCGAVIGNAQAQAPATPAPANNDDAASQIATILQSIAQRVSSVETDISKLRTDATTAT